MKKCVAYCRVSTDHTDQTNSFENQTNHYIEKFQSEGFNPAKIGLVHHKDGTSQKNQIGIYADEGISGTSLKNRKAFKTMLEDAKKKVFDVIFIKNISRFSRSVEDGVKAIKDLKQLGIAVIIEDGNINSLDSNSELVLNMMMSMAQEESQSKARSVKWGIRKLQEKGGWNMPAPYGFNVEKGFLKINEEEAENIRTVYNLFINEGNGVGKIARYLNEKGIPTKKNRQWSQIQVSKLLDNHLYNGIQRTHTIESDDINRHTKKMVDESEHIIHTIERIIDNDTFNRVQIERVERNKMWANNTHHSNTNLFSTLLYCGKCGGNYKRKKRNTYKRKDGTSKDLGYEWTCAINDMYAKTRCDCRNAYNEDELLLDIQREIFRLKRNETDDLFQLYLSVRFNYDRTDETLNELKNREQKTNRKLEILLEDRAEEIIDKDMYKDRIKPLNKELEGIKAEIRRIEQYEYDVEIAKQKYKQYIKEIKEVDVNNLTNTILKRLFKNIVVKKILDMKFLEFNYNFMDISIEELLKEAKEEGKQFNHITVRTGNKSVCISDSNDEEEVIQVS